LESSVNASQVIADQRRRAELRVTLRVIAARVAAGPLHLHFFRHHEVAGVEIPVRLIGDDLIAVHLEARAGRCGVGPGGDRRNQRGREQQRAKHRRTHR
jgi:hypothetical protein